MQSSAGAILLVTGAYPPQFSAGGLQCQAIAAILRDRLSIRVLTTATTPGIARHEVVDGIAVSRVTLDLKSRASRLLSAVRMFIELLRLMPGIALIHVQGFSTKNIVLAALAKRRPLVMHLQTAKHDKPDAAHAAGRLEWWVFSSADLYLSVSPGLSQRHLDAGLPPEKLREIPNGVDVARFTSASTGERAALRARLAEPLERPMLLFVGVMSADKQPHVLFEAWLRTQQQSRLASTLVFVGATNPTLFELGDRLGEQLRADAATSGFAERVTFVAPTTAIMTVTAFPVDFIATAVGLNVVDFLPSAPALPQTHRALREFYGRMYYRLPSF